LRHQARAVGGVDLDHPVEVIVDEVLDEVLDQVLAPGQVAEGVEGVVEVLDDDGAGRINRVDGVEPPGQRVVGAEALDPVAEPSPRYFY